MATADSTGRTFSPRVGYFLGRLALSLGVGALSLVGLPLVAGAVLLVGGNLALTVFSRFGRQAAYEQQMVDLYRGDIAEQLGIDPARVTRGDLKEAARDNDVLAQALERQNRKTMISIGTALLASTVTFGLVYFFGAASAVKSFAHSMLDSTTFATLANFFGIGTVSGLSGLVLHDGLDLLIGRKTGVAKAAAHDLMLGMQADLAQGKSVSPEQVYAALVAGDPTLAARIAEEFSRPYERMSGAQQQKAMDKIGVADEMLELATAINSREVSPGHLAYMMGDAAPKPAARPVTDEAPRSNFVGRLGLAPSAAASHVERLQQQPQFATERIV